MGTALITLLPALITGAPAVIGAISGVIGNLVHKHETMTVPATSTGVVHGPGPTGSIEVPATGAEKKSAAMSDFSLFAGPLLGLIIKHETGKDVDILALEQAVSALIDDFVLLNKALGIFAAPKPQPA